MRKAVVLGLSLFLALGAAGCQDQVTDPASTPGLSPLGIEATQSVQGLNGSLAASGLQVRLPADLHLTDQYLAEAARRAINPDDYVCAPPQPISIWINEAIQGSLAEEDALAIAVNDYGANNVVLYNALFFESAEDTRQSFGYDGEYTNALRRTDKDARRFWDIDASEIQMVSLRGSVLTDVERVTEIYEFFGNTPEVAAAGAQELHDLIVASTTLNGGDFPYFSFNAFAFGGIPGLTSPRIAMGDGIMAGYDAIGYGDVAPQAIYAHEFAHHIQFQNDYEIDATDPEETRYTELMADAMSAYFLTHKRGAAMNQKRVEQFLDVFFQIGDCVFDNPGHHGTHAQRLKAAQFGFELADQAHKQGHILTADAFRALFDAEYDEIIAPDAI